jgi:hypothetical protein
MLITANRSIGAGRLLQWLAWGRRENYPKTITAAHNLWWLWIKELPWTGPYMKEAKRNHGSRQKRAQRGLGLGRKNG